jgi:hypothetical protein
MSGSLEPLFALDCGATGPQVILVRLSDRRWKPKQIKLAAIVPIFDPSVLDPCGHLSITGSQ